MKITLTPETPEDEQRLRERAKSGTGSIMSSAFSLTRALTLAAVQWVEANPLKPGPGSVLRRNYQHSGGDRIRIVTEDGRLMDTLGRQCNGRDWPIGDGEHDYTLLFDPSEAS